MTRFTPYTYILIRVSDLIDFIDLINSKVFLSFILFSKSPEHTLVLNYTQSPTLTLTNTQVHL